MTALTRDQLTEQLNLQHQMNCTVNPEWVASRYQWPRAMALEAAELLEHLGWKWWKHQEPNVPQAQLEVVDIWHFILSHQLAKCNGDTELTVVHIEDAVKHPEDVVFVGYAPVSLDSMHDVREHCDAFIALAAGGIVSITAFTKLMAGVGLTWEQLHVQYMAKNILNIFRQMHGYKDGTYIKTWMGKEDNEVLMDLVTARPNASAEQLFTKLETIYTSVKETQ